MFECLHLSLSLPGLYLESSSDQPSLCNSQVDKFALKINNSGEDLILVNETLSQAHNVPFCAKIPAKEMASINALHYPKGRLMFLRFTWPRYQRGLRGIEINTISVRRFQSNPLMTVLCQ